MPIGEAWLGEFDLEMASTRRVLERVPGDKGSWKPHSKSFAMGHLAQLVAGMPRWIENALRQTSLDLGQFSGYSMETTETLLKVFDGGVKASREALATTPDKDWQATWTLKRGDMALYSAPRVAVVRNHLNHLYHHRGQLTVYLRLTDVPVPGIYGPSADDRPPA